MARRRTIRCKTATLFSGHPASCSFYLQLESTGNEYLIFPTGHLAFVLNDNAGVEIGKSESFWPSLTRQFRGEKFRVELSTGDGVFAKVTKRRCTYTITLLQGSTGVVFVSEASEGKMSAEALGIRNVDGSSGRWQAELDDGTKTLFHRQLVVLAFAAQVWPGGP